jgi:hypothetical protein
VERIPPEVLAEDRRLFWDVDAEKLDPRKHEDFILGRVLSMGSWAALSAVRRELGDAGLRAFVQRAPHRLDRRSRRFFQVVLSIPETSCTTTPFRKSNDPLFAP